MNTMPNSRYILPVFEERTPQGGIRTQDPYSRLFKERVIFLGTQIDQVSADDVMAQLLVLEALNRDEDITMYINSPGGDFAAMTSVYDTMRYISPKVNTICLGQASSAAAILLAAGDKGGRWALPNARILIHQPSVQGERGQASDIQIQADESRRVRLWLESTLSELTGKDVDEIHKDIERDKYLTAAQAVEYGLIDGVLNSRKGK